MLELIPVFLSSHRTIILKMNGGVLLKKWRVFPDSISALELIGYRKLNAKTRKKFCPRDDGILGSFLGMLGC